MTLFKIIDRKTGKEPTDRVIVAQARLGNLITCDIDGFYVNEDGQIILVDDCGNCTWLDVNRFKVEMQYEASPTGEWKKEVIKKIQDHIQHHDYGDFGLGATMGLMDAIQIIKEIQ